MKSLGRCVLLIACTAGCGPSDGGESAADPGSLRTPADPDLPNLVVISVDTLNRDALRAFDPEAQELPNLDRFADRAVRFTRAFSSASWTLPAHASLLTGLYPNRHGAVHRDVIMDAGVTTLAERLRNVGYYSTAFTHGGYLRRRFGYAQGFDRYDQWNDSGSRFQEVFPDVSAAGDGVIGRAIRFLQTLPDSAPPYFLFVHTYNVHDYYKRVNSEARSLHFLDCLQGREDCSEEEWIELEELYEAEIRRFDEAFGTFLDELERAPRRPTFVALLSDHGEGFDHERDRIHHAGRLHDDLIRIPLMFAGPGLDPGTVETPVSIVDVAPTLLRLAGLESSLEFDGRPVLGASAPPEDQPRTFVAMEHSVYWTAEGRRELPVARSRPLAFAVISGAYRLIRGSDSEELYSVEADPVQEFNLLPERQDVARRLTAGANPVLRRKLELQRLRADDDPELTRRLQALGYL